MNEMSKNNDVYGERESGEITHCGCDVDWIDCPRHNETSCAGTVCAVCGVTDFDCEEEYGKQESE